MFRVSRISDRKMNAFCLRCRANRRCTMKSMTNRRGSARTAVIGTCNTCNARVSRFISEKQARSFSGEALTLPGRGGF